MDGWMSLSDPLDDTLTFSQSGLVMLSRFHGTNINIFTVFAGTNDVSKSRYNMGRISYTI
jgi:hypothetical protein